MAALQPIVLWPMGSKIAKFVTRVEITTPESGVPVHAISSAESFDLMPQDGLYKPCPGSSEPLFQ